MDKLYDLLQQLPGGPKFISIYGPYILPQSSDYATLEAAANIGLFPTVGEILYPSIIVAAIFGFLRTILTSIAFAVSAINLVFYNIVLLFIPFSYRTIKWNSCTFLPLTPTIINSVSGNENKQD